MDIDEMVLEAAGDQVETQPLDEDMEQEQEQTQETLETLAETPLSALPRGDRADRDRGERIERGARGEMGGERVRESERQHQYPIVYSGSAAGMNTTGGGGSGAGGGGGLGVKTRGVFTGGREGAFGFTFVAWLLLQFCDERNALSVMVLLLRVCGSGASHYADLHA